MPSVRPPRRAAPLGIAAAAAAAVAACNGQTLTLGNRTPAPYHFEVPQIVAELRSDVRTDNPTLTGDLLEIYFTSERLSGNGDVWFARRSDPSAPFGAPFRMPVLVPELVYSDRSTVDGFLSDDGLTLFFSSSPFLTPGDAGPRPGDAGTTRDGGTTPSADLYVAWRQAVDAPFSFTQPLDDLNTGGDERDPWLTPDGKTLYFTSDRDGALTVYTAAVKPR